MIDFSKKEWKILLILILIFLIIIFLFKIRIVLLPFIFAIILAYLFKPFIKRLKKREFSSNGAIIILLIVIFNIIFISALVLLPVFIREVEILALSLPEYISIIENEYNKLSNLYKRLDIPFIAEIVNQFLGEIEDNALAFLNNISNYILNSLSILLSIVISPIITYYILRDHELFKDTIYKIIPAHNRKIFISLFDEINRIFIAYLRGQFWVSVIVGIMVSIGLYFLKVKFFLILGLIAGITNIIPYIGPIIGTIPAALIALMSSYLQTIGVILLFLIIQQIESSLIAPRIMSKSVGLHPLTVIFSILAGAELFGIWGLIFSIPFAGVFKAVINIYLDHSSPLKKIY